MCIDEEVEKIGGTNSQNPTGMPRNPGLRGLVWKSGVPENYIGKSKKRTRNP